MTRSRSSRQHPVLDLGEQRARFQAGEQGVRFLLVSGKPIEEPVAWYEPIVMNT